MNFFTKLSLILIVALSASLSTKAQSKNVDRDSVVLAYRPNSSILLVDYKNNEIQLQNIFSFVKKNVAKLQQNQSHINIVSYIKAGEVGNPQAINNASIQASVVRAEFKTKYGIPHSAITFSIDTTQNLSNIVRVDYVATAVPAYSNNAIYYAENGSVATMRDQMNKYKPSVPYTNYWMHLAKIDPNMYGGGVIDNNIEIVGNVESAAVLDSFDEPIKPEQFIPDSEIEPKSLQEEQTNVVPMVALTPAEPAQQTEVEPKAKKELKTNVAPMGGYGAYNQVFGLKTNLLYWAVALPNLEMEFYIGKRVSLNLEGAYTWGWFLPADKAYFLWNAGAELRMWFKGDAKFNGHFMGIYGNAGQYDFKFGQIGNQGDYYGVGLSYGYLLPIKNRFHMEFSIGAGWAQYSRLQYEHMDGYNFELETSQANNYFGITKAKVSCVWRF